LTRADAGTRSPKAKRESDAQAIFPEPRSVKKQIPISSVFMPSFLINTYKIRLEILRVSNPVVTHRNRILEIASVPLYHGIVDRAVLNFSTYWDNWLGTTVVGYYNTSNPLQPVLNGWLPSTEYSFWYDVLRSEKPLTFFYEITLIRGATYVSRIALGTSTEPTGEGPEDVSP
jgi:hypothetical protein